MDLLKEWQKQCNLYSSDLDLPNKVYERKDIQATVNILKDFFGIDFFSEEFHYESNLDDINWLHMLLANNRNLGCISAVLDAANLIDYGRKSTHVIKNQLYHYRNDANSLRSFLYELYIYRALDYYKIIHEKKPIVNNQELEGYINYGNEKLIFECAKIYSPNTIDIYSLRNVVYYFIEKIKRYKYGCSMVAAIRLKKKYKGKHISALKDQINEFLHYYSNCAKKGLSINYSSSTEVSDLLAYDYNAIGRIEIEMQKERFDIIVKMPPSNTFMNGLLRQRITVNFSQKIEREQINKKIRNIIYKKKEQLKGHENRKIIFVDFEMTNELRSVAFNFTGEAVIDIANLQNYINSFNTDIIVCITVRKYMFLIPEVKTIVLAKDNNNDVLSFLRSINFNYMF